LAPRSTAAWACHRQQPGQVVQCDFLGGRGGRGRAASTAPEVTPSWCGRRSSSLLSLSALSDAASFQRLETSTLTSRDVEEPAGEGRKAPPAPPAPPPPPPPPPPPLARHLLSPAPCRHLLHIYLAHGGASVSLRAARAVLAPLARALEPLLSSTFPSRRSSSRSRSAAPWLGRAPSSSRSRSLQVAARRL